MIWRREYGIRSGGLWADSILIPGMDIESGYAGDDGER